MTFAEFRQTLTTASPPVVAALLQSLWHDAKGNWAEAHRIAQDVSGTGHGFTPTCTGRKVISNARYWYRQAGVEPSTDALDNE